MKKIFVSATMILLIAGSSVSAQSWSLTGNSATNTSTNFIGTKDAQAVAFRTNNLERMRIAGNGFVGIGITTPKALFHLPSKGNVTLAATDNFLLGAVNANNLALDYNKIQARNNGAAYTLQLNPGGGAVGLGNVTGTTNPGLYVHTDGSVAAGGQYTQFNYAFTVNQGYTNNGVYLYNPVGNTNDSYLLHGENNSTRGLGLFIENTSSENQNYAILGRTYGSGTAVAGVNGGSGIAVYASAYTGTAVNAYSTNNYGIYAATTNATYAAYFNKSIFVNGSVFTSSDRKLKQNIQDFTSAIDIISQLHPKKYDYRQDGMYKSMKLPQGTHYGLIAQDVEKVLPNLVKQTIFNPALENSATGLGNASDTIDFKAVNYTELIPILIKAVQEQQALIEDLSERVKQLGSISPTPATTGNGSNSLLLLNHASLEQNSPNPVNTTTTIRYTTPAGCKAQLFITDNNGNIIKQNNLIAGSNGNVIIDGSRLSAGVYTYTLIVDGKQTAVKKMVVAR